MDQMAQLSTEFTSLVAEAIGLPRDAFERYYHGIGESASGTKRQDRLKVVKYPDMGEVAGKGGNNQGVGPHKGMESSAYFGENS